VHEAERLSTSRNGFDFVGLIGRNTVDTLPLVTFQADVDRGIVQDAFGSELRSCPSMDARQARYET
jgi:hypothetical protein